MSQPSSSSSLIKVDLKAREAHQPISEDELADAVASLSGQLYYPLGNPGDRRDWIHYQKVIETEPARSISVFITKVDGEFVIGRSTSHKKPGGYFILNKSVANSKKDEIRVADINDAISLFNELRAAKSGGGKRRHRKQTRRNRKHRTTRRRSMSRKD